MREHANRILKFSHFLYPEGHSSYTKKHSIFHGQLSLLFLIEIKIGWKEMSIKDWMLLGILYLAIIAPYFVLSLGAIIAIFSGIIFNGEKIVGTNNLLLSLSLSL